MVGGTSPTTVAQIQGLSTATAIAEQLKLAIEHANGHNGGITVAQHGPTLTIGYRRVQNDEAVLPDRSYLTGSVRNKTRIKTRFSSPGGFETLSRGFLDPAHETYSPYNAMTYRNLSSRTVYNSKLVAHQKQFGASSHGATEHATASFRFTSIPAEGTVLMIMDGLNNMGLFEVDIIGDGASWPGATPLTAGSSVAAFNNDLSAVINASGLLIDSDLVTIDSGIPVIKLTQQIPGPQGQLPLLLFDGYLGNTNDWHAVTSPQIPEYFSTVTPMSSRPFEREATGSINSLNYELAGQASEHKYHRNNIERLRLKEEKPTFHNEAAAYFDGTNYFTGSDNNSLSFGDGTSDDPFSISAWIKMSTGFVPNFHIFNKASGSSAEWQFGMSSTARLNMVLFDSNGSNYSGKYGDTNMVTKQGIWTHVAATYGGTGGQSRITLYVNGVAEEGSGYQNTYTAMHNTSSPFTIGRSDAGGTFASFAGNSSGLIDEVSVWATELSEAEIKEIYHGGVYDENISPGPGNLDRHPKYQNLVSWWRFGDSMPDQITTGTLNYVVDRKGSNHITGSSTGAPEVAYGPPPGRGEVLVTSSLYDNGFVSHMIPRTDKQYAWITGSII